LCAILVHHFNLFKEVVVYVFFSNSLTVTFNEASSGVACDLKSRGFEVLCKATEKVVGHVKPYSITGTLPLIRELKVRHISFFPFFMVTCL